MSELPGRIGDYEVEAELGAGGMATVYRVRHALLHSRYALKVLDPRYRASPAARARFLDEARIQHTHLDHPNIVKVVNVVATADHAALVMELVDGPSLEDVLGELRQRPDEQKRIMLGVLGGVGHAHAAGIVHRDLKPANVLLHRRGDRWFPKVTDFGIAKLSAELAAPGKKSTHGDSRMGTLHYMSPEQLKRAKDATPRSDIFSLGVMLYELATGALPFDGDNEYEVMDRVIHGRYLAPEERDPRIDPVVAAVIRGALALEPADRFASCAEMAAALEGDLAPPVTAARADEAWAAEPTPVPAPAPTRPVRARPVVAPAVIRGERTFRAFDIRSPSLRSVERVLVPVAVALVTCLVFVVLLGPLIGVLVGPLAGAALGTKLDAPRQRRRFHAASTILVRVDAKAAHRTLLATLMTGLGFEPSDESEHGSLHPIEPTTSGGEARAFQVRTSNLAAIDALLARCERDLLGHDYFPPANRQALENPEGFAEFLAKLLWDNGLDRPGEAHCLVDVLQWHEPR